MNRTGAVAGRSLRSPLGRAGCATQGGDQAPVLFGGAHGEAQGPIQPRLAAHVAHQQARGAGLIEGRCGAANSTSRKLCA